MNLLRRLPTTRLVALCASVVALGLAIVAVAGAVGSDPKPPQAKPLADAIHDALAAPPVDGVTATVQFKNNLVNAAGFEGISPFIAGATGRVWWSKDQRFRLELKGNSGDSNLVVDHNDWWAYDGSSNTVYRGTIPADKQDANKPADHTGVPTVAEIEKKLQAIMKDVAIAGPTPGVDAHQPAYSVRVTPKDQGGLLAAVNLAWDAARGTPLSIGVYAKNHDTPVLELAATDVQYGPIDSAAFSIQPPPGAKVSKVASGNGGADHGAAKEPAKGAGPTLKDVTFKYSAPDALGGRQRTDLHAKQFGDKVGVVAVYGQGLSSVVVIERPADAADAKPPASSGGHGHGQVELPTTDVGGAPAQVLDTPLGGAIQWTKDGVSYVVAGSQPRSVLEAAARGL
jgi:outer membrane lipoprotein-sorting protein